MGYCFVGTGKDKSGFACSNEGWRRFLQMAYVGGWKPRFSEEERWPDIIGGVEHTYEYRFDSMDATEVKAFVTAIRAALISPGLDELNKSRPTILPQSLVDEMITFLEGDGANGIEWA